MACNCIPRIVPANPVATCKDCIIAKSLRFGCDDAPNPCGETVTVDLSNYNETSVCKNCSVTYQIESYDHKGFSSVTINNSGVLTYTTSNDFEKNKEYEIVYKVICPCSNPILSSSGKVYVCKKDLCKTAPKGAACNNCNGEYIKANDHIITSINSTLNKCSGSLTFNLSSLVNETSTSAITYALISATSGLTSVAINSSTGVLTLSKLGSGYTTQKVVWSATNGTLTDVAELTIEIKNLCSGVICPQGFICNECTGNCDAITIDLEIN